MLIADRHNDGDRPCGVQLGFDDERGVVNFSGRWTIDGVDGDLFGGAVLVEFDLQSLIFDDFYLLGLGLSERQCLGDLRTEPTELEHRYDGTGNKRDEGKGAKDWKKSSRAACLVGVVDLHLHSCVSLPIWPRPCARHLESSID